MVAKKLSRLLRFQSSAVIATFLDFTITLLLKEVAGINYLISTSSGTVTGGILNFLLCRNWVFKAERFPAGKQVFRYTVTWCGSILLNITGVYLLTSAAGFNYILSKVITSSVIGLTFNYSMQKRFVFSARRIGLTEFSGQSNHQPAVVPIAKTQTIEKSHARSSKKNHESKG